ncbi:MAG: hypothetical protein IJ411_05660 [Oscillospiraceae bacterium]|nr:hypothetical protein [Oscillospiraceae bacterium]
MITIANLTGSILSAALTLAVYLVSSYAFYKVAKIRMLPNAWLAFIPIFGLYITGMIGDSLKYNHYKINHYISDIPLAYALPILSLATNVLGVVPLVGGLAVSLVSLLLWAAEIMVYYFIFSLYGEPKNCVLFTALSIIPVVGPLLVLYVLKDRRY